jgi:hypothetical protein
LSYSIIYTTRREKAIKELLARSAPKLNDWMTHGLVGSLKLPMTWLDEAKVTYFMSFLLFILLLILFSVGDVRTG